MALREIQNLHTEGEHLAREFGAALGGDFAIAVRRQPLDPRDLTQGERLRFEAFTHAARREEWLRGRHALKALLQLRHADPDTSRIRFPHPTLSLTHAAGLALAAAAHNPQMRGLGIDYEALRPMRLESMRFFLQDAEQKSLTPPVTPTALLRLWVVKEALFKADLDNARRGLRHYRLENPHAGSGAAKYTDGTMITTFRYASLEWGGGFVCLAVAE